MLKAAPVKRDYTSQGWLMRLSTWGRMAREVREAVLSAGLVWVEMAELICSEYVDDGVWRGGVC